MFRTLYAHHQEVNCIDAVSGTILLVSGHSVHNLREKLCTERPLIERTIQDAASMHPPDDEHVMLETCSGM